MNGFDLTFAMDDIQSLSALVEVEVAGRRYFLESVHEENVFTPDGQVPRIVLYVEEER